MKQFFCKPESLERSLWLWSLGAWKDIQINAEFKLMVGVGMSPHRICGNFQQKIPKFPQKSLFKIWPSWRIFQIWPSWFKIDIAAETLETLPGTNDINSQMEIRRIISAPVLHPTIAPPPVSAFSNGDLVVKLITIVHLHNEVTELATNLVNGGSID